MPALLVNMATIEDFVIAFEAQEGLEITNLHDELAPTRDDIKLQHALDRAHELLNGRYIMTNDCGRALLRLSAKQLILWITRYLLDTIHSRPFVEDDYKKAMEWVDLTCEECKVRCPLTSAEIKDILGADYVPSKPRARFYSGDQCVNRQLFGRVEKIEYYDRLGDEWRFER